MLSCARVGGRRLMRHACLSTGFVVAALLLASCGQQTASTSANAGSDAGATQTTAPAPPPNPQINLAIAAQFDEAGPFSEGLAAVRVAGRFGYIDKQGVTVIPPQFDFAGAFSDGLAHVGIGGK